MGFCNLKINLKFECKLKSEGESSLEFYVLEFIQYAFFIPVDVKKIEIYRLRNTFYTENKTLIRTPYDFPQEMIDFHKGDKLALPKGAKHFDNRHEYYRDSVKFLTYTFPDRFLKWNLDMRRRKEKDLLLN